MLAPGRPETLQACALLAALDEREITLREFAEAMLPLSSEALQVTATVLFCCAGRGFHPELLSEARRVCSDLASSCRVLS